MSPTKTLKVRVALLCILVGTVLALVGVVTDHWAVLSPHVEHHNTTCEAAHFGLWRICTKRIFVGDKERSCGPITLPGEKNCSYFRHFNPGESSEIFEVTTQKEYSISAAAIAIFSLGFIIVGTLCALLSFRKKRDYLLRPASMFYIFAGFGQCLKPEAVDFGVRTDSLQPVAPGRHGLRGTFFGLVLSSSWAHFQPPGGKP
ncbi:CACNG1 [Cervus elaphus hippelaphus]|uniref:CACNG1 n=1 Tax=Cervus elaphus hippelaphus TaxID=46360 RepID=A0A212D9M1_CEREH|nr:CACNG1 [Cervus elaphus hippelaphus]